MFAVEKRDTKITLNTSLLNLGFSLRKNGRVNNKAKRNLIKMKVNGGISLRLILEKTGLPPPTMAANIIANKASWWLSRLGNF